MESLHAADPRRIGEYRLLGRLGEGGMGSVFLAQSPRGRTVAVKLVRSELAEKPDFRRRFEREVRAARKVGGEWTAPVLDAETDVAQPWLATGYIPGLSLQDVVVEHAGPLPERTVRTLANRMALALGSVHEAGLIHRDVKPSNILVTLDGPRLIDFGIARALEGAEDTQLTRTGSAVGSPAFMSPEQARGATLTAASDIFSLGSVLVFAATGRKPFGNEQIGVHALLFRVAEDEADLTGVPEGLRGLVAACLTKDPAARPSLAEIVARTADPESAPGPDGQGNGAAEPWLPAGLVAQLGQHAAGLLDVEASGVREATPTQPAPGQSQDRRGRGGGKGQGDRGPRRRRAVVGTAVALALLAGGGTLLAVRGMDSPDGDGKDGKDAEKAPGESSKPSGKEKGGSKKPYVDLDSLKPAPGGALPKEYLGAWQSDVNRRIGQAPVLRRFEIRQGDEGEALVKNFDVHTNMLCREVATLDRYDSAIATIHRKSAESHLGGALGCEPYETQTLSAGADGSLYWGVPGTDERVELHRVSGGMTTPVPDAMVGEWKPAGGRKNVQALGDFERYSFDQGPVGTASARFSKSGKGGDCVWKETLSAADGKSLVYAGSEAGGTCGDEGTAGDNGPPFKVRMLGDDELGITLAHAPAEAKPVILKRAG